MRFGRTSDLGLIAVRRESAPGDFEDAEWTYPEVGTTRDDLPSGYAHLRRHALVGEGRAAFDAAAAATGSTRRPAQPRSRAAKTVRLAVRRQTRIGGNGAASTREAIGGRRPTCRTGPTMGRGPSRGAALPVQRDSATSGAESDLVAHRPGRTHLERSDLPDMRVIRAIKAVRMTAMATSFLVVLMAATIYLRNIGDAESRCIGQRIGCLDRRHPLEHLFAHSKRRRERMEISAPQW